MKKLSEPEIRNRLDRCAPEFREALEKSLRALGTELDRSNLDPRTLTALTLRENAEVRHEIATRDDRKIVEPGTYPGMRDRVYRLEVLEDPPVMQDVQGGLRSRGMRPAKTTPVQTVSPRGVESVTLAGKRAYEKATAIRTHLPSVLDEAGNCAADEIGDHILILTDLRSKLGNLNLSKGQFGYEEVQVISLTIENLRTRQCNIAGKSRMTKDRKVHDQKGPMARGFTGPGRDHPTIRDRVANTDLGAKPAKVARPKKSARKRTIV